MKQLYFAVSILVLFYIPDIKGQNQPPECDEIRAKLNKNMALIDSAANTAQMIQQKDCNFAKKNVNLMKKYGKCLPNEEGMSTIYRNMRFVTRIICENVNKRILGCFSPENLKQFNECTNKTLNYMDFIAKQQNKESSTDSDKPQVRRKRFLLQNLLSGLSEGFQGRSGGSSGGGLLEGGLSTLQDGLSTITGGLQSRKLKKSAQMNGLTSFEHRCCMMHLKSDCFLTKVLHTCAEKSELRLYKAFQTVFSLAVRDVVEIACGRIDTLDQCEKFSNDYDVEHDLGF